MIDIVLQVQTSNLEASLKENIMIPWGFMGFFLLYIFNAFVPLVGLRSFGWPSLSVQKLEMADDLQCYEWK